MNNKIKNIKLSVIMPLFNVEDTLRLALDSILMQEVDFDYEIIAVNDASSDNTLNILNEYSSKYRNIKIINHTENRGNAISFYDGLSASNGTYFCVLDGDDYYTVKNKLQKQVNFLDGDKDEIYTAVVHKYFRANKEGKILNDPQLFSTVSEYGYSDFIQSKFYFHTSTYMYRNIFRGNVPESFKEECSRGDNPRTFMHLLYTKGKVKVLNFVGSVYFYTEKGIWSQISIEEQRDRNVRMLQYLQDKFQTELEKKYYDRVINWVKGKPISKPNPDNWLSKEKHLQVIRKIADRYAFQEKDFVFKSLYKSEFVDSYCESIGFIEAREHDLIPSKPVMHNKDNILITISNLTTTGGGIYYEIKDIIKLYKQSKVYLLLTDLDDIKDLDPAVANQLNEFSNLTIVCGKSSDENKLKELVDKIITVSPKKIYHYCGHNNVYANALIQSMYGTNICCFSFDHGFSLGLDNTSYDKYIAKRPTDYQTLSKLYKDKVIYIPCWNTDKATQNKYIPFNNHSALITASGAARYYKLDGQGYIDYVVELLKNTKGKHVHYGPIEEEQLNVIYAKLKNEGLSKENFVHIPWADNIVASMYEQNVDVFIEPFPVVSYKLTLEVLSGGIPVFSSSSKLRMGTLDFIYNEAMRWTSKEDFVGQLTNLTKEELKKHSKLSREYFEKNHSLEILSKYFYQEKSFCIPSKICCYDAKVTDISNIDNLIYIAPVAKKVTTVTNILPEKQKIVFSNFKPNSFWQNIFSVRNKNNHKIITILGAKLKVRKGICKKILSVQQDDACKKISFLGINFKIKNNKLLMLSQIKELENKYNEINKKVYRHKLLIRSLEQKQELLDNEAKIEELNSKLEQEVKESEAKIEELNSKLEQEVKGSETKIEELNSKLEQEVKGSETKIEELNSKLEHEVKESETKIRVLNDKLEQYKTQTATQEQKHDALFSDLASRLNKFDEGAIKFSKEAYWSNVYRDTSANSIWLKNKAVSPGRWAVSYIVLYIIYRILDEIKPTHILELGLGQSSKLMVQYADAFNANLNICESNKSWIAFFAKQFPTAERYVNICRVGEKEFVSPYQSNAYLDFEKSLDDKKFDFVFIDGPEGSKNYSRPNLLEIADHLQDTFVVILDDFNRNGEKETWELFKNKLNEKNIKFVEKIYTSDKSAALLCSPDLSYLTSL